MSPDECKKRQSGFWTHEYRPNRDEEVWRCDRHKLSEAVRDIMMDCRESQVFQEDPHRYLNTRFGEGTAYVYFNKSNSDNPYFDYRTPRHMAQDSARGRDMALGYYGSSSGTFTTTATSGTSDSMYWLHAAAQQHLSRPVQKHQKAIAGKGLGSRPAKKKLVRNLPFVCGSGDLLAALQREFDHWAGQNMEKIHG
jgi:hypothetical protein